MSEDDKPRGEPTTKAKAKIPNAQNIRAPVPGRTGSAPGAAAG